MKLTSTLLLSSALVATAAWISTPEAPDSATWMTHEAAVASIGADHIGGESTNLLENEWVTIDTLIAPNPLRIDRYRVNFISDSVEGYQVPILTDEANAVHSMTVTARDEGDGDIRMTSGSMVLHGQTVWFHTTAGDPDVVQTYTYPTWGSGSDPLGPGPVISRAQWLRRPGDTRYKDGINVPEIMKFKKKIISVDNDSGKAQFTLASTEGLHVDDFVLVSGNVSYPSDWQITALTPTSVTLNVAYATANADGFIEGLILTMERDIIAFCNWQWSVDSVNWTTVTSSNQVFENSGELTLVDGSRKTDRVRAVYSVRGSLLAALVAEPKVWMRPKTRILP